MKNNTNISQILCRFFKKNGFFNKFKLVLLKIDDITFEKFQTLMLSPNGLFYFLHSYIKNAHDYSYNKYELLHILESIESDLFKINFIIIDYLRYDTINFIRHEKIEDYVLAYFKDLKSINSIDGIFDYLIKNHYTINQLFLFSPFRSKYGRSIFWTNVYYKHLQLIYNKLWGTR